MAGEIFKYAVIVFADLVGSARLSDVLLPEDYDRLVSEFHSKADFALSKIRLPSGIECDGGIRGDEVVLIMTLVDEKNDALPLIAATEAIKFAVDLNTLWFLSETNKKRVNNSATPHRIAVGLHYGLVVRKNHIRGHWEIIDSQSQWTSYNKTVPEGFAVNFAKRVEGLSRNGKTTGIALSQSFYSVCRNEGLPIFIGHPLPGEARGFEQREVIYELTGQSVLREQKELIGETPGLKNNIELLDKALSRDPENTLLLIELAIDILFSRGGTEEYNYTLSLAEKASKVVDNPFPLLYRMARTYHRQEEFIDAKRLLEQVKDGEPSLSWAQLDLAGIHWQLGERPKNVDESFDEYNNRRLEEYNNGIRVLYDFISTQPRHFYAYNLLALLQSRKSILNIMPSDRNRLIAEAKKSLKTARDLNKKPEYWYKGTEGYILKAEGNKNGADSCFMHAINIVNSFNGCLPVEHFFQSGYAVPAFVPPRPSKLIEQWDKALKVKDSVDV